VAERWTVEQVAAVAPAPSSIAAAEGLASPTTWVSLGADARAAWGRCRGSGAEPYETMVDHAEVAWRCSCPSRRLPCKHALALLLLWARGEVPEGAAPSSVASWIEGRDRRASRDSHPTGRDAAGDTDGGSDGSDPPADGAPDRGDLDRARDERVARMFAGLVELDRWLDDRLRTGLSDPALARYDTWDSLAARLVDARAGALANRVRRLAGLVGAGPDWHSDVLAELGLLHLITQAGLRIGQLDGPLADAVATASGWQVRHADVLAGVPDTDEWFVAGRSDVREDRIEVRRLWLYGTRSGRWAMLLSFAAYQQTLDDSWQVGTIVDADLHRYPGGSLRALAGRRHADPLPLAPPAARSVAEACDAVGTAVAAEPWIERYPAMVRAAPAVHDGRWVLTDHTGSLPVVGPVRSLATALAASAGEPVTLTVEWSPHGVTPLTLHLDDRTIDVGPRADPTFVGAA
jgi:hypothetical protein